MQTANFELFTRIHTFVPKAANRPGKKMKMKEWSRTERPRERLLEKGPASLSLAADGTGVLYTGGEEIEVLYDDRDIRPGAMFADADLFGIPLRAVVSPKSLANGGIEISARDKSFKETVSAADAAIWLRDKVVEMLNA